MAVPRSIRAPSRGQCLSRLDGQKNLVFGIVLTELGAKTEDFTADVESGMVMAPGGNQLWNDIACQVAKSPLGADSFDDMFRSASSSSTAKGSQSSQGFGRMTLSMARKWEKV